MSQISDASIGMLLTIHAAVRRDLERILAALDVLSASAASPAARAAETGAVVEYWTALASHLHHHHEVEDAEVWPTVRDALGEQGADVLAAMEAEHAAISAGEIEAGRAVNALMTEPTAEAAATAAAAVRRFRDVALRHLAHEEADAVPLIVAAFSDEAWGEFQVRRQRDPGTDAFLPWVLDGAPVRAVEGVTAAMPPQVRDLLLQQWMPAHDRRVQALLRIG